jgi:putative transposase
MDYYEIINLDKHQRLALARLCILKDNSISKALLCELLSINRSSLYLSSKLDLRDQVIKVSILETLTKHPFYGYRRVCLDLKLGKNRTRRIMRKYGIFPKYRKLKFRAPFKQGDLRQPVRLIPNYLKQLKLDKSLNKPNLVWSVDFTYLWYQTKFFYVATVIDAYTKEILGKEISTLHNTNLVTRALNNALANNPAPKYHHSDQGSEYTSYEYQALLAKHSIIQSLSTKSSPWQNGYQESFYSQFKLELGSPLGYLSQAELLVGVYKQLHYYNTQRIHTTIKMTPREFRLKCELGLKREEKRGKVGRMEFGV